MSMFAKENPAIGGLCHLVEAATALSMLVESSTKKDGSPQQQSSEPAVVAVAERSVISDDEDGSSKKSSDRSKRDIFPQRLLAILNDASLSDIVTWLPNGQSFVIVRPDVFTETVLPKYLPPQDARGSTKYPSFTRKLNRWGFRQITRGPDTGAFHHSLFRRDEPQLCVQMVCQRSRDRRQKSSKTTASAQAPRTTRNLPPKKRAFKLENRPILPLVPDPNETKRILSCASVAITVDDNTSSTGSVSSSSNSSVSGTRTPSPPTTVCTQRMLAPAPTPNRSTHLSKDPSVIAEALRQSEQNERIRLAKAMLYQSYLQALGGR